MPSSHTAERGFTLIELSIVLVIIGLIVGGVLVGRDLISAAEARAQITQIEKFSQAANTFFVKYGALPGDITPNAVTQFGFTVSPTRAGTTGNGDGNGELDGGCCSWNQLGETVWFWEDLSANAQLIEGTFTAAATSNSCTSNATCSVFFPSAKLGNGNFVYVYSGYAAKCVPSCPATGFGPNFFGFSVINSMNSGNVDGAAIHPAPGLTVSQAYAIDTKIDDGQPATGNVLAQYLGLGGTPGWSVSGSSPGASTCYDTSSGTAAYSLGYSGGSLVNCGISFKMQAGD